MDFEAAAARQTHLVANRSAKNGQNVMFLKAEIELNFCVMLFTADFGFARFLQDGVMAATLCGSPMYMVSIDSMLLFNIYCLC